MDDFRINGNITIPGYVKSTSLMIVKMHSPYRTGNLKYNGIRIEEHANGFTIYIDEELAKYGVWLDEKQFLGGWNHTEASKAKISKANKGMKKLRNQTPKELRPKATPGRHANPHYGWFSERAVNDLTEYLKNKFYGKVVY